MSNEIKRKRLGKLLWEVTKERVGGDRKHGWGIEDSMAVIEQLAAEDLPEGQTLSEECLALIRKVVNMSAYRQQLEDPKLPGGSLLDKSEKNAKRTSSIADIVREFGD